MIIFRRALSCHVRHTRGIFGEALAATAVAYGLTGLRVVRPNQVGLVERLGKYIRTASPGITMMYPWGIGRMEKIRMDMRKVEIEEQSIITREQLNASITAVAYYRVQDAYMARYKVEDFENTVPTLTQTTLRNVMGTFSLAEANSQRQMINIRLQAELQDQIQEWGMQVIAVELQEIRPTQRVQESMNDIIIAEQRKIAATNQAHACEIEADGVRRATIKEAEGRADAMRLGAQAHADATRMDARARADALRLEYEAADKYFQGNAQLYQRLQTTEAALKDNSVFLLPQDGGVLNMLDLARMSIKKD